jgi:hypothetical protein
VELPNILSLTLIKILFPSKEALNE